MVVVTCQRGGFDLGGPVVTIVGVVSNMKTTLILGFALLFLAVILKIVFARR